MQSSQHMLRAMLEPHSTSHAHGVVAMGVMIVLLQLV